MRRWMSGWWPRGLGILAALGLVACGGKVDQEVFDQEVADIRSTLDDHESRIGANSADIEALGERVAGLEEELRTLREDFQARITELEEGLRFSLPVHFEFDRAELRAVDRPLLDRFASVVREYYGDALVTVEGFADPAGTRAYNIDLSRRRAQTVRDYLVEQGGVSAERLRTAAYGETRDRQVKPGEQGPGRPGLENRRVTFVVEFSGRLPQ